MSVSYLVAGTALISFVLCALARRVPLLDAPDGGRKQQKAPVPRTGGLGMLGALMIALAAFAATSGPGAMAEAQPVQILFMAFLAVSPWLIGLADDWLDLSARFKLCLICLWAALAAAPFLVSGPMLIGVAVFGWLIVITNAANFMDGANGLALGTLGIMHVGLFPAYAIMMLCFGTCAPDLFGEYAIVAQFAMFGAVLGFLAWNVRGVLYAGDCGSLGAGGLFGLLAVYHVSASMDGLRVALLGLTLSLPILVDVLLTLAWRSLKGRNLMQAHTDHAYQRLVARGWRHIAVAALWWGMTLLCAVAGVLALFSPVATGDPTDAFPVQQLVALIALGAAGSGLWLWERRRA